VAASELTRAALGVGPRLSGEPGALGMAHSRGMSLDGLSAMTGSSRTCGADPFSEGMECGISL